MSAGIEPLKKSIRIWWRINGVRDRETLHLAPTPENIDYAKGVAKMIAGQIKLGTFQRSQVFPNTTARHSQRFGHYIDKWEMLTASRVAPSSWRTYHNKVFCHIAPYWSDKNIADIDADKLEFWVYKILQPKLSPKTVKNIVMIFRQIWVLWARQQDNPKDPTRYVRFNRNDAEDIDPYTRDEITIIIGSEDRPQFKNLWTVMLWSGLSTHELLALAVEDLDLENRCLYVNRGFVGNTLKATKNRRRKRQVELLPVVIEALNQQKTFANRHGVKTVDVLNRDNATTNKQTLTWLWQNPRSQTHYTYNQLEWVWRRRLETCGVRYLPLNYGRHTYASQVLSSGAVSAEWLANQLGHGNTEMIHKHYGKFIPKDASHMIDRLARALAD